MGAGDRPRRRGGVLQLPRRRRSRRPPPMEAICEGAPAHRRLVRRTDWLSKHGVDLDLDLTQVPQGVARGGCANRQNAG